jgi:hypothetical protein
VEISWAVVLWSSGLAVLAACNLLLLARAARDLAALPTTTSDAVRRNRRLQWGLSALYVIGCAWRSVIPVYDVPRIALVDSALASVLVGRSVATVAELAFVAQWALTLRDTARVTGSRLGSWSARAVVPMIAVAEVCSWYSVLTTSNLGHVFEESLWALAAALMVASLLAAWQRWQPAHRRAVLLFCAVGSAYVAYMVCVDVPRYASRWFADETAGRAYLGFLEGLRDIAQPHLVTYAFDVWRHEFAWMASYFSIGVWISIALIHSPLPDFNRRPSPTR